MSKELEGVTAILASPTYGPVDPVLQRDMRLAVMTAANHGLRWLGDASNDRMGWAATRNASAQTLLDLGGEADGIMWIDSDIKMPHNAIARLIDTARREGLDVLSGIYHQRGAPFFPVIYHMDRKKETFQIVEDYEPDMLICPGGCGFGFVWTSYKVVKAISELKEFDPKKKGWFPDTRHIEGGKGEDFNFCIYAHRAGFEVWADTGVQVLHAYKNTFVGRDDYLKAKEEIKKGVLVPATGKDWGELG